jgi:hypothetical protein
MFPVTAAVNCCVWLAAAMAARTGDTVTLALGAATVMLIGADGDRLPDMPLTITVVVPVVAVPDAVRVITLVVAVLVGVNDAVTPEGNPVTDRVTLSAKPFRATMAILLVALPPWPTVAAVGAAESVKFGDGPDLLLPHPVKTNVPNTPSSSAYTTLRFIAIFS